MSFPPHAVTVTPPTVYKAKPSCFWKIFAGIALSAVVGILLVGLAVIRVNSVKRDATAAKATAAAAKAQAVTATAVASDAMNQVQAEAGLLQSVRQALASAQSDGSLTAAEVAALKAKVVALQAAKGGTVGSPRTARPAALGPGSGTATGIFGPRPFPPQGTPPPSTSSTAGCALTVRSGPLTLDGTVCGP